MTVTVERFGCSDAAHGAARVHTIIIFVQERPGAVDRIVGVLRRRRAQMQTLVLARTEEPEVVRFTMTVNDAEVSIENLVEQLRRIVDVQQVVSLTEEQAVARELALVKVESTVANYNEILDTAHLFGAHTIDITPKTVTFEVMGSEEHVEKCIAALQKYGIRELARSGRVALARSTGDE
jgi:acetolactate synthase-1/3 small subunit